MPCNWPKEEDYCNVHESRETFPNGFRIYFQNDSVGFSGLHMGGKVRIISHDKETDSYLLRKSGYGGWDGIGTTTYRPPEYLIGFVVDGIWQSRGRVEYTKKFMRKAKNEAQAIFIKTIKEREDAT